MHDVGALNAASGEAIAPFVAQPSDGIALVLVAGGGRMPSALDKALKAAGVPTVSPESERTDTVLKTEARRTGIDLTPDAAKLVTDHLGEDAGRVVELVEILRAAFGPDATLTVDDVEPYLGEAGGVPRYELTNAIDRGDTAGALVSLHRLLNATSPRDPRPLHPMQVIATLIPHYQRMLRLDDPSIRSEQDAVAALGGKVKAYPARRARGVAPSRNRGFARSARSSRRRGARPARRDRCERRDGDRGARRPTRVAGAAPRCLDGQPAALSGTSVLLLGRGGSSCRGAAHEP